MSRSGKTLAPRPRDVGSPDPGVVGVPRGVDELVTDQVGSAIGPERPGLGRRHDPVPTAGPTAGVPPASHTEPGRLAGGALGLTSVLFCIVTGAAPLAAMLFNIPVATLGGDYSSLAAFAVATVALTIFSVGCIAMRRRVTSAGGFYTFVTRGLGRVLGLGFGLLIALCYMVFAAAVTGTMGYFASTTVASFTGLALPAWVYVIIGLGLMSAFAVFHIELTAKVLGVRVRRHILHATPRTAPPSEGVQRPTRTYVRL